MDFYHLSPPAARYLAAKGKMHPSGFDTRAVMTDTIDVFFSIISGNRGYNSGSTNAKLREILEANAFPQKIEFIRGVLEGWTRSGRLGSSIPNNDLPTNNNEQLFWEGAQEKSWLSPSGGKFVWVTVGAQGGDSEYIAIVLKSTREGKLECTGAERFESLSKRLRAMATA